MDWFWWNKEEKLGSRVNRTVVAVLVLQLAIFGICVLGLGLASNAHENEVLKLETPVQSRAELLQRYLNNLSLSAHFTGHQLSQTRQQLPGPNVTDELQQACLPILLDALEASSASGAFVIWEQEQVAYPILYLRDRQPDINHKDYSDIRYLRGPAELAKQNRILLDTEWHSTLGTMEQEQDFLQQPVAAFQANGRTEQCGYWSPAFRLSAYDKKIMTYTVPLAGPDRQIYGVFGFEISQDALLKHMMVSEIPFLNAVYLLLRLDNFPTVPLDIPMSSGAYADVAFHQNEMLYFTDMGPDNSDLYQINGANRRECIGIVQDMQLYNSDDYYAPQNWALIGMVPAERFHLMQYNLLRTLAISLGVTILLSVILMLFLSRRTLKPLNNLTRQIEKLHDEKDFIPEKTNIVEIDQLMALIKAYRTNDQQVDFDDLFREFIERVQTLTPTERVIFNYYMENKTNKEILDLMHISSNTLKTHNSHIYSKLDVSSKDELSLYIELIRKSGLAEEIQ